MRIVNDIQIGEIGKGFRSTLGCQVPDRHVTAHDLRYLDGQEVRSVQGLAFRADPGRHFAGEGEIQEALDDSRGVEHDQ